MKTWRLGVWIGAAVCASCVAPIIHAQTKRSEGDIEAGRKLALFACTGCHVVTPDQPFKPLIIGQPSFNEIANRPNVTAASLQRDLEALPDVPSDPKIMSKPVLSTEELRDVTAFIVSLRTKP